MARKIEKIRLKSRLAIKFWLRFFSKIAIKNTIMQIAF